MFKIHRLDLFNVHMMKSLSFVCNAYCVFSFVLYLNAVFFSVLRECKQLQCSLSDKSLLLREKANSSKSQFFIELLTNACCLDIAAQYSHRMKVPCINKQQNCYVWCFVNTS